MSCDVGLRPHVWTYNGHRIDECASCGAPRPGTVSAKGACSWCGEVAVLHGGVCYPCRKDANKAGVHPEPALGAVGRFTAEGCVVFPDASATIGARQQEEPLAVGSVSGTERGA